MLTKAIQFILLVGCVGSVLGQVPTWGKCPKVDTQANVDIEKYLGVWYEIEAFPNYFQKGRCAMANYTLKADGHIKVVNTEVVRGKVRQAVGDAFRPNDTEQGKLKVRFSKYMPYGNYWIVDTDYDSYTLVYSCTEVASLFKLTYGWILARENTLTNTTVTALKSKLTSFGVDVKPFKTDDRSNCPY